MMKFKIVLQFQPTLNLLPNIQYYHSETVFLIAFPIFGTLIILFMDDEGSKENFEHRESDQ